MVPPSGSDRAQSDSLCDELCQQIVRLDEGSLKLIAALERLQRRGTKNSLQADRLQRQIRELSGERRQLVAMLNGLGHGYPCDHQLINQSPEGDDQS